MTKPNSRRITFEFLPDAATRLDAIKALTGRPSYAAVIKDALVLFEWWTEQEQKGYEIGLVRDDTLMKIVKMNFVKPLDKSSPSGKRSPKRRRKPDG